MRTSAAVVLALILSAPAAQADGPRDVLVVLDRGRDAQAGAEAQAALALRLARALDSRDAAVLLLAAGADEDGRPKLAAPTPTQAGLAALEDKEGFAYTGPTDLRGVLGPALVGRVGGAPIDLLLVGPFSAPLQDVPARRRPRLARAVADWNEEAPPGSRIYPLGATPEALAALDGARGLVTAGWLVLGFQRPTAETRPYSPLSHPGTAAISLLAEVRVRADVLPVGAAGAPPPLLTAATDLADDVIERTTTEGLQAFRVRRRLRDGRTATLSFRPAKVEGVTLMGAAPRPLTFTWDRLAPDARLETSGGGPAPVFEALDAEAGASVVRSYRLVRTRAGPRPAWAAAAEPPAGLRWSVGAETAVSPEMVESELRVEFEARAATPLDVQGKLALAADGMPAVLELPYVLRVPPGRARLVFESAPAAVPGAAADLPSRLTVHADNANVPNVLPIRASCDPPLAGWLVATLRSADGRLDAWHLSGPEEVTVGTAYELRFVSLDAPDAAPEDLAWPCTVTLTLGDVEGVVASGEGVVEIRLRRPRIVRGSGPLELVVEDGEVRATAPLVLRLDPDGGDGDWLLSLVRVPPTVTTLAGDVETWDVAVHEPGVWHVRPDGPWRGGAAEVFRDAWSTVRLHVAWPRGEAPGELEATVRIPARWGTRGWLFVGLAALALLLGVTVFLQMRAPRVRGTLLYVVEDMPGTVGRLDLAPVGRRPAAVFADAHGRLSLRAGTSMVARIRPTRVGGMLEVVGGPVKEERRLLVDGLALRAGRHLLRYVSGQPAEAEAAAAMEDVPDLLGAEFDLESGRIERL